MENYFWLHKQVWNLGRSRVCLIRTTAVANGECALPCSPWLCGVMAVPWMLVSIRQHSHTRWGESGPALIMYFPSLGQMVTATLPWLACNLHRGADTQSARQFSAQLSPWQPPFDPFSSEIGGCCHIRSLAHSFLKWRTDCWLLRMSEIAWTCHSVTTPPTERLYWGRGRG